MKHINEVLLQTWQDAHQLILIGATVLGLLILGIALAIAKAKGHRVRPIVMWIGTNMALLFNAEGTWNVLTTKVHLPPDFVVLIFAVFEVALMIAMSLAAEHYNRTTERDETGKVTKAGHPGKAIYIVWFIALVSGGIVASNAPTGTEQAMRIAVPVIVVLLWWAALTAEGQTRSRGRFAYSPTRLMERYGWLTPDEDPDFERLARERRIRAMVKYGHRLEANLLGVWWNEWRLTRLAREADDAMATEVAEKVERVADIVTRVVPSRRKRAELAAAAGSSAVSEAEAVAQLLRILDGTVTAEERRGGSGGRGARQIAAEVAPLVPSLQPGRVVELVLEYLDRHVESPRVAAGKSRGDERTDDGVDGRASRPQDQSSGVEVGGSQLPSWETTPRQPALTTPGVGSNGTGGARPAAPARALVPSQPARPVSPAPVLGSAVPAVDARGAARPAEGEGSTRARVFALLDENVAADDRRDNIQLTDFVVAELQVSGTERETVGRYVRAWRKAVDAGDRVPQTGRLRLVGRDNRS